MYLLFHIRLLRWKESNNPCHRSARVKFALKVRSLGKRVSPCLARSKRILLRASYSNSKSEDKQLARKRIKREKEREKEKQREGDNRLKPELKKAFYSRDRWTLSR